MEMFYVLVLFRAGYRGGMIGHNTRKVLLLFLFLSLFFVPSRSQVIALKGSYGDSCRRQQVR
jgi:hypothetical protein